METTSREPRGYNPADDERVPRLSSSEGGNDSRLQWCRDTVNDDDYKVSFQSVRRNKLAIVENSVGDVDPKVALFRARVVGDFCWKSLFHELREWRTLKSTNDDVYIGCARNIDSLTDREKRQGPFLEPTHVPVLDERDVNSPKNNITQRITSARDI